jgi:hypothetical protein
MTILLGRYTELFKGYGMVEQLEVHMPRRRLGTSISMKLTLLMPDVDEQTLTDEEMRTHLFWQAQECLRILKNNGFELQEPPEIIITGADTSRLGDPTLRIMHQATLEVEFVEPEMFSTGTRP